MWECPKCGREFENSEQNHFCPDPPKTIDEYITAQTGDVQARLREVYAAIKAALPDADEKTTPSRIYPP
jgi:threonine synthase